MSAGSPAPEPRFAIVAAMIGDPTRARMLSALMGGQALAAGELARAAGVGAATASAHIARLLDSGLVSSRSQGRHRYLQLAGEDVARVLEALSVVAERHAVVDAQWRRAAFRPLKQARTCYRHLAGELGVALLDGLLARGTLQPDATRRDGLQFRLSETGRAELQALGLALPADTAPRYACACLDWSERRDHLAGALATALLDHGLSHDWWRRRSGSRALQLTPAGTRALDPWLRAAQAAAPARQAS